MKKSFGLIGLILVAVVLFIFMRFGSDSDAEKSGGGNSSDLAQTNAKADGQEEEPKKEKPLPEGILEDLSSEYMRGYGSSRLSIHDDLMLMFEVLGDFNSILKGRTNLPATTNKELAATLIGNNNDKIRFISPKAKFLNENGEIVDRWNVPLFFHFQDGYLPDIRSAGPDQKMWSDDDTEFALKSE